MTQIRYDQFAKEYLEEVLSPLGKVERSFEVPGEAKQVDVWFEPEAKVGIAEPRSLLERITATPCCFEPFSKGPSRQDLRRCLLKLLWVQDLEYRKDRTVTEAALPMLWVLASTVSQPILSDSQAEARKDWPKGMYFCARLIRTVIVVIEELPQTEETLWLRILGRGPTLERAIGEVLALRKDDPQRERILRLLTSWKVSIELAGLLDREEEDLLMALSQAYLEWEQATEQRGEQRAKREAVESMLKVRFGELDEALGMIVPQLLSLSIEEYTALVLQQSREQLIERFGPTENSSS